MYIPYSLFGLMEGIHCWQTLLHHVLYLISYQSKCFQHNFSFDLIKIKFLCLRYKLFFSLMTGILFADFTEHTRSHILLLCCSENVLFRFFIRNSAGIFIVDINKTETEQITWTIFDKPIAFLNNCGEYCNNI